MNYSPYTKMTSEQLLEEISKQKEKIKKINEHIAVLKKLKVAEDFLAKEHNDKSEKPKTEQVTKPETLQTSIPKSTEQKPIKQQNQQTTQHQNHQQSKPKVGGFFNGSRN